MIDIEEYSVLPTYVLIKPAPEREQSEGGIYLSDLIERRQVYGEIVQVGDGVTEVEEGDWVLYRRWEGVHISIDAGTLREESCYMLCRTDAIQAIVNNSVLEPLGKWLAVNPIDDRIKETPSGILIAEIGYLNAMEYDGTLTSIRQDEVEPPTPLNKGTVASVGPDCREVAVGDKVLCEEWAGTEIDLAGVTYLMVTEDQVVGVLAP